MKKLRWLIASFLPAVFLTAATLAFAADQTSTTYILRDGIVTVQGGYTSSASFKAEISTGQLVTGENTGSSFIQREGWLYYPTASSPVVSATGGAQQVSLTWTAATPTFATITDYQLGTATVSGGPYTFESVGAVLSSTKTGLSESTTYYFKVRAYTGTLLLAESAEANATTAAGSGGGGEEEGGGGGGGGGGGSGSGGYGTATVIFSGKSYPNSEVKLLRDARIVAAMTVGGDANFEIRLDGQRSGTYNFTISATDSDGRRADAQTFSVTLTSGITTNISGIFLAPTIDVDADAVVRGDNVGILGRTVPDGEVIISVHSDPEYFIQTGADDNGAYYLAFDTSQLELGNHQTKSKTAIQNEISSYSSPVAFAVVSTSGEIINPGPGAGGSMLGDYNGDNRVNLIDFSIAAYWFGQSITPTFATIEKSESNGDGKIDLVDFSIIAYYWTG